MFARGITPVGGVRLKLDAELDCIGITPDGGDMLRLGGAAFNVGGGASRPPTELESPICAGPPEPLKLFFTIFFDLVFLRFQNLFL